MKYLRNNKLSKTTLGMVSALAVLPMAGSAAIIAWSPSVDMFADGVGTDGDQSFVSKNGTSVLALNMDERAITAATRTVNGETFTDIDLPGLGSIIGVGGITMSTTIAGDTGASFGDGGFSGDLDVFNLIASGLFGAGTITYSGLTVGNTYEIQVFTNDARISGGRANNNVDWQTGFSDGVNSLAVSATNGSNGASSLNNRVSDGLGGWTGETSGDSIIGTFIATATTQSFETAGTSDGGANWTNGGRSQINGIQLRETAVIPEPSSIALLGLGGLALIMRRRK